MSTLHHENLIKIDNFLREVKQYQSPLTLTARSIAEAYNGYWTPNSTTYGHIDPSGFPLDIVRRFQTRFRL